MHVFKTGRSFPPRLLGRIESALALSLAVILVPISLFAIEIVPKDYSAWLFSLISFVTIWFLRSQKDDLTGLSQRSFLLLIGLLFAAVRIAWVLIMPTIPISDYEFYYRLAGRIADFKPLTDLDWRSLNMSTWGYPVFLGLWFALITQSLLLAKMINILLGIAALFVFYRLSQFFGETIGRAATIFFAIWPAQILYTSVLGSEHLALLTILCAIWFLFKALYESNHNKWFSALAGIFFGMTYLTRTGLFLLLPVAVIMILLYPLKVKDKVVYLSILMIAFAVAIGIFYGSIKAIYGVLPISSNLSTLLSGTNFESTGGWNIERFRRLLEI